MNILLVSATVAEIAPLKEYLKTQGQSLPEDVFIYNNHQIKLLITGVGMMATTYALTKILRTQTFDIALQAGIAGSFNKNIALTEVVMVSKEILGDLGAEDPYNFWDVFELGFVGDNEFPYENKYLNASFPSLFKNTNLRRVSALSINMVSGSAFTATARFKKFGCDLESMEGAAFHFVCLQEKIPFAQIRSVSNYVEARDKSKWKIKEAIESLNKWLAGFLENLS